MITQFKEELPEGMTTPDFTRKPIALTIQEGKSLGLWKDSSPSQMLVTTCIFQEGWGADPVISYLRIINIIHKLPNKSEAKGLDLWCVVKTHFILPSFKTVCIYIIRSNNNNMLWSNTNYVTCLRAFYHIWVNRTTQRNNLFNYLHVAKYWRKWHIISVA